ncbi:hypothetical protein [Oceanobacter sp. 3_MG-2023]|uniref:hypothetical protein n=1 Tax=Oceanobacter sp. 3_MG-2023 TaxID=3062622 RepID=UPI00273756BB|nr:hypothetical protein [Oceanobacter sp. 3_MG-2023]MDP2505382.1 hypothetical protein [Oceanobacter sp. 3_MG-2023]
MHQLGIHSHHELMQLPAIDVRHWRQFFALEPAGFHVENQRLGHATATLVNFLARLKPEHRLTATDLFATPESLEADANPMPVSASESRALAMALKAAFKKPD